MAHTEERGSPSGRTAGKRCVLVLLSCGWFAPLVLAAALFQQFVRIEMLPPIEGRKVLTGFDFLGMANAMLMVGLVWAGLSAGMLAYWVLQLLDGGPWKRSSPAGPQAAPRQE